MKLPSARGSPFRSLHRVRYQIIRLNCESRYLRFYYSVSRSAPDFIELPSFLLSSLLSSRLSRFPLCRFFHYSMLPLCLFCLRVLLFIHPRPVRFFVFSLLCLFFLQFLCSPAVFSLHSLLFLYSLIPSNLFSLLFSVYSPCIFCCLSICSLFSFRSLTALFSLYSPIPLNPFSLLYEDSPGSKKHRG